ncbi:MAG TPA: hypothetical protein PK006_10565 [Saprospiraceae bacterium]|nr:hypothetical protein [Saprospiraceae bacterium]
MEHKKQKLISKKHFAYRMLLYALVSLFLVTLSILIGMLGYHYVAALSWIDSFHMSCLILTGMGPTNEMPSNSAKLFSSFYALYSGVAFLTMCAIILSPIVHRILHILHIEEGNQSNG